MANIDINAAVVAAAIDENNGKKYMKYKTDSGKTYGVLINEAVGNAMGFDDITDNEVIEPKPAGLTLRTVRAVSANGKVNAKFPAGKPTTPIYKEGGTIKVARLGKTEGLVLSVTGTTGERFRKVSGRDTGQNFGNAA